MKVCVPEISWHNCEPVYTIHISPKIGPDDTYYVATGAADRLVRIWKIFFETVQAVANPVQVKFIAEFTVHQASVNAVRFSPNGKYLISGSDDRSLVLWEVGSWDVKSYGEEEDEIDSKDIWPVKRILRGHLEGVYDLSWAPCSTKVASASVDNSVIVWDVTNGNKLAVLREARSYVQGVAWDPKNNFIVTLSSDRQARFYSVSKGFHCVSRISQTAAISGNGNGSTSSLPLFADDMVTRSFFRRAGFSPDGRFVALSGGLIDIPKPEKEKEREMQSSKALSGSTPTPTPANGQVQPSATTTRHAAHLVVCASTKRPGKPILSWPSPRRAVVAAAFCPLTFEAIHGVAKKRDADGVLLQTGQNKTRRRFVAALVAADALILVETSKTSRPIGYVGGLHLDQLTDASWSSDGRLLLASSTDGYCTLVVFGENELGIPMPVENVQLEQNEVEATGKASKPKKEESKKEVPVDCLKTNTTENSTGKRRIAPVAVAEPLSAAASVFFGLDTAGQRQMASSASEAGTSRASSSISLSKMEVDGSDSGKRPDDAFKEQPPVVVNVLVPRRRLAPTTVSCLPGAAPDQPTDN